MRGKTPTSCEAQARLAEGVGAQERSPRRAASSRRATRSRGVPRPPTRHACRGRGCAQAVPFVERVVVAARELERRRAQVARVGVVPHRRPERAPEAVRGLAGSASPGSRQPARSTQGLRDARGSRTMAGRAPGAAASGRAPPAPARARGRPARRRSGAGRRPPGARSSSARIMARAGMTSSVQCPAPAQRASNVLPAHPARRAPRGSCTTTSSPSNPTTTTSWKRPRPMSQATIERAPAPHVTRGSGRVPA